MSVGSDEYLDLPLHKCSENVCLSITYSIALVQCAACVNVLSSVQIMNNTRVFRRYCQPYLEHCYVGNVEGNNYQVRRYFTARLEATGIQPGTSGAFKTRL